MEKMFGLAFIDCCGSISLEEGQRFYPESKLEELESIMEELEEELSEEEALCIVEILDTDKKAWRFAD